MGDVIPLFNENSCPVENGKYAFLTERDIVIGNSAKDLKEWVKAGFDAIDFQFPTGQNIDCVMAREILRMAGIKN